MFQKGKDDLDILARRATDKVDEFETTIGPGLRIKGDIEGKQNLRLEGSFDGKVTLNGLLLISDGGNFKGELTADNVIIEGEFEGTVISSKKLELRSSAKFKGHITSNIVAIAEGSFFEGEIKMGNNGNGQQFSFEEKRKIRTENGSR